jgi:DNA-binding HxlR family transcriptional regulator
MDFDEKDQLQISDGEIANLTEYFKAIGHPKRFHLLKFLSLENNCDFSRLKELTELSKTALANHLSQLENLKLIKRVERGQYEITEDGKNLVRITIALYKESHFSEKASRQSLSKQYMKFISNIKMLSNVEFKRYWVSQLASLHGCIEYLGIELSKPWLFGITGHAFIINIRDHICPSGPTAWKNDMIIDLTKNIGIKIDEYYAETCYRDYKEKLVNGWDFVKSSINHNNPCYGWQIGEIKEFYVIYGYDNVGYYYKGYYQEGGAGPKPWKNIGEMFLRLYSVKKINTLVDHGTQVKMALQMVLKHSRNPKEWINKPYYSSGLEGFDKWIKWVENGRAEQFGNAYNSRAWAECRQEAVNFLQEAKTHLNNKLKPYFDKAIKNYEIVAKNLKKISDMYPFDMNKLTIEPIDVNEKSKDATNLLKKAKEAEANGLSDLENIIENL